MSIISEEQKRDRELKLKARLKAFSEQLDKYREGALIYTKKEIMGENYPGNALLFKKQLIRPRKFCTILGTIINKKIADWTMDDLITWKIVVDVFLKKNTFRRSPLRERAKEISDMLGKIGISFIYTERYFAKVISLPEIETILLPKTVEMFLKNEQVPLKAKEKPPRNMGGRVVEKRGFDIDPRWREQPWLRKLPVKPEPSHREKVEAERYINLTDALGNLISKIKDYCHSCELEKIVARFMAKIEGHDIGGPEELLEVLKKIHKALECDGKLLDNAVFALKNICVLFIHFAKNISYNSKEQVVTRKPATPAIHHMKMAAIRLSRMCNIVLGVDENERISPRDLKLGAAFFDNFYISIETLTRSITEKQRDPEPGSSDKPRIPIKADSGKPVAKAKPQILEQGKLFSEKQDIWIKHAAKEGLRVRH